VAGFAASGLAHAWEKPVHADTRRSMIALGTLVEIQVRGLPPEAADRAISAAFAEIRRYEAVVAAVGRVEAGVFQPDGEVAGLMAACDRYWRLSSGAFDCALGTLVQAWDFAGSEPRLPEPDALERAQGASGWEAVQPGPDGAWIFTQPRTLNFGAIAKGAAVDRAVAVLQAHGVQHALVDAGGDVRALGSGWTAGIRHPRQEDAFAGMVRVDGRAAATSGDYEQYFLREERRYHHLLDPRTGNPAAGVQSVTVLAPTAQEADALATAIFVLGPRDGLSLAESLPGVEVFIIDAHGQSAASAGFPLD
jgi:FAD:protein FMN transferase